MNIDNKSRAFGDSTTVADSMAEQQWQYHQQSLEEQERYRWQKQQTLSQSIPRSLAPANQDASPDPTDEMFQSQSTTTDNEEKTTITLSQETRLKIEDLKRLIYKYPQCHRNPRVVIRCAIHFCNDGDNSFLDEKLEQLRMIDSTARYPPM